MILVCPDIYPGLCNSLFAYGTVLGFALERNKAIRIIYISRRRFKHKKRGLIHETIERELRIWGSRGLKLVQLILIRFTMFTAVRCSEPSSGVKIGQLMETVKGPVCFLRGWGYTDIDILKKYRKEILDDIGILEWINYSGSEEKKGQVTLGVHVRRKDYKYFLNGKYYYNQDTYKRWITHCYSQMRSVQVKIVFFSDDPDYVSDMLSDIGQLKHSSVEEDLYVLSKSDYILGPPSTFTMWAAFMSGESKSMHMYQEMPSEKDIFVDWHTLAEFNATKA